MLTAALLLSYVAGCGCCQAWTWDEVPTATGYRLYYSNRPDQWYACDYLELTEFSCTDGVCSDTGQADPMPGSPRLYVTIQAYNANGESPWDHPERLGCE